MLPVWAWILIAVAVLLLVILIIGLVMGGKAKFDNKKCYADRRANWSPEYVQDIIRLGYLTDRIESRAGLSAKNSEYMHALDALKNESKEGKCNDWFIKTLMDKGKFVSRAGAGFGDVAKITMELANEALQELDQKYGYVDKTKRELPTRERPLFANPDFLPPAFRQVLEVKPFDAGFSDAQTPRGERPALSRMGSALTPRQIINPTVVRRVRKQQVPKMGAGATNEFADIEDEVIPLTAQQIENFDKVVEAIQNNVPANVAVQQVQAQAPAEQDRSYWDSLYDYIIEKVTQATLGTTGAV